jgi:regulator of CtrA degradation
MTLNLDKSSLNLFGDSAFFNAAYNETLRLLVRARHYMRDGGTADNASLPARAQQRFALESLRMTSRLTRLMAWLLAQRAAQKGHMSPAEALDDGFRLSTVAICLERNAEEAVLPAPLRELLDETYLLYVRLARIDDMLRQSAARHATTVATTQANALSRLENRLDNVASLQPDSGPTTSS